MEKEKLEAEELEKVTGGNSNKALQYLECENCGKIFPATWCGDECDNCGSIKFKYVVKSWAAKSF